MKKTTIRIRIVHNGKQYLGECLEFPVMTHGATLEELVENMEKALGLFLRGEHAEPAPGEQEAVVAVRVALPECGK